MKLFQDKLVSPIEIVNSIWLQVVDTLKGLFLCKVESIDIVLHLQDGMVYSIIFLQVCISGVRTDFIKLWELLIGVTLWNIWVTRPQNFFRINGYHLLRLRILFGYK
jgi:hypothetical protein